MNNKIVVGAVCFLLGTGAGALVRGWMHPKCFPEGDWYQCKHDQGECLDKLGRCYGELALPCKRDSEKGGR